MTPGSFLKRQKRQENDQDDFQGIKRFDSFFSDTPKFELQNRKLDQLITEKNIRLQLQENDVVSEPPFDEEPPQMVLQRQPQISIGMNTALFSLTIVCAVLGIVTNFY